VRNVGVASAGSRPDGAEPDQPPAAAIGLQDAAHFDDHEISDCDPEEPSFGASAGVSRNDKQPDESVTDT
jgi:hypothetical protein